MESGLITFFDVTKCGLYRIRKTGIESEHISGSLAETLKDVADWLRGRDFTKTVPWSSEDVISRTNIYSKCVHHNPTTGDYLFVFWKEHGDGSGAISGISADAKFGDNQKDAYHVAAKAQGKKLVLGEPMYYWFIPEHNLLASIKFSKSIADTKLVHDFISSCVRFRIPHKLKKTTHSTQFNQFKKRDIKVNHIDFRSEDDKYSMRFKFETKQKQFSLEGANLRKLSSQITHLVVRDTISSKSKTDEKPFFQLYDEVFKAKSTVDGQRQVEIVSSEFLSPSDLRAIFQTYKSTQSTGNGWNNIGFRTKSSRNTTKWVDSFVSREYINIEENLKTSDVYYHAKTLLQELDRERDSLLSSIKSDDIRLQDDEQLDRDNSEAANDAVEELSGVE